MLILAGTVPIDKFPLTFGRLEPESGIISVNGLNIPCTQGIGAMIASALATTKYMGLEPPNALVAGDIGKGDGTRAIYNYLIREAPGIFSKPSPFLANTLVLHYCLPDMALIKDLCKSLERCPQRPISIADASSMYGAKAAGLARMFDVFTPDLTEIAFLADSEAIHPAYINKHLFNSSSSEVPELISNAYRNNNAASVLLIKGEVDYIAKEGKILDTVSEPDVPELEAIGGTGDTITGMVSAFCYAGLELSEAAIIAARSNRTAAKFADPSLATRIWEIIDHFPLVFRENLCNWSGICVR